MPAYDITLSVGVQASDLKTVAKELTSNIEGIFNKNAGKIVTKQFQTLQTNMSRAYNSTTQVVNAMTELEGKTFNTKEYDKLIKEFEALDEAENKAILNLNNFKATLLSQVRSGIPATAEQKKKLADLSVALKDVRADMARVTAQMAQLQAAGKATIAGVDTDQYKRYRDQLNDLTNRMSLYIRTAEDMGKAKLDFGNVIAKNFGDNIVDFANNIQQLPKMVEGVFDQIAKQTPPAVQVIYSVAKAAIKIVVNEIINTTKQVVGVIKNGIIKALNLATTAAKNFAKALAKAASSAFLRPFKKLGDAIGGIGKKATESDFSMKKFGRAILQYGIGVRSLYRLINKLRTALFEGFADLALAY